MSSSPDSPAGLLLTADLLHRWDIELAADDSAYAASYPGPPGPGPVHTVYVPVPRFGVDVVDRWRGAAVAAVQALPGEWAGVLDGIAAATGGQDPQVLHELTLAKLAREPIEDLRIDLEDGFRAHRGPIDDADEDAAAIRAAAVAGSWPDRPRSWGLRIRSLGGPTRHRGLRTLDLFLSHLGAPPGPGFVITLPKVTSVAQIVVFAEVLAMLENSYGALRFEIQVETPQTLLGADGRLPLPEMIRAGGGRVSGLHFGTYDYTASLGILGPYQDLRHPVADAAKDLMMLAAAETGVRVSDGSDNKVPVGEAATVAQRWARHADGVLRALWAGIYQGWDLHPAQLPSRFAATFAFYRTGSADAVDRLVRYHRQDATGGVLDEPATAFALARHLASARACGAVTADEIAPLTDATIAHYLHRGALPGGLEEGTSRAPESG
jgi:citrate lyase beta subunit